MEDVDYMSAMAQRHAVRSYLDRPIDREVVERLRQEIDSANEESGLHMQLVCDEERAFGGMMAHYGKFSGVRNYLALVGEKGSRLDETCGYYGECLALLAQSLGLNSCWVGLTYSKGKVAAEIAPGEKLSLVVSLGYGATQGVAHKSKPMDALCQVSGGMPDWFRSGMEAAMLAPTATNQQKYCVVLQGDTAHVKDKGGAYSKVDLGIVELHFELGSGRKVFPS